MDIYGSLNSNDSIQNETSIDTPTFNSTDNPQAFSSTINPSPFISALELLKNTEVDSNQIEELLKVCNSRLKNSTNQLAIPRLGNSNTVTPSRNIADPINLSNSLSTVVNHQEIIVECTERICKYYATLVYKYQHKIHQQTKYENFVINDDVSPSFLKIYDAKSFKLPPLPKSISDIKRAKLVSDCQELLQKTRESLLKNIINIYREDRNNHLEILKSFDTFESFTESSIVLDMINKFPILTDYLKDIYQNFLSKVKSLTKLGRDKYTTNLAQRHKENNGRPATDYNSDTDISLASIRSRQSKKSRNDLKSIIPTNKVDNNSKIQKSQTPCRNGINCRYQPKCAFFHSNEFPININPAAGTIPPNLKRKRIPQENPLNNLMTGPTKISFTGHHT